MIQANAAMPLPHEVALKLGAQPVPSAQVFSGLASLFSDSEVAQWLSVRTTDQCRAASRYFQDLAGQLSAVRVHQLTYIPALFGGAACRVDCKVEPASCHLTIGESCRLVCSAPFVARENALILTRAPHVALFGDSRKLQAIADRLDFGDVWSDESGRDCLSARGALEHNIRSLLKAC